MDSGKLATKTGLFDPQVFVFHLKTKTKTKSKTKSYQQQINQIQNFKIKKFEETLKACPSPQKAFLSVLIYTIAMP